MSTLSNQLRFDSRATSAAIAEVVKLFPDAGIHEIVRRCLDRGIPANKDLVRNVRRTVRREPEEAAPPIKSPNHAQTEQWAREREAGMRREVQAETETLAAKVGSAFEAKLDGVRPALALPDELRAGTQDNAEGRVVRRTWAEDLLIQQPTLNSNDVQTALRATFGLGLDSETVLDALKAVREINGMRYITRRRVAPIDAPPPPRPKPDGNAPRLLEYLVGDVVRYASTTVAGLQGALERLGAEHGINPQAISVWRPARTRVLVQVQVVDDEERP